MYDFLAAGEGAYGSSAVNPVLVASANNTVVCREGLVKFVCYN